MENMFSGNQEKKIPKSFKDCYKTDGITKNLWLWCERLEKWGFILFWILIVGGLIFSISTSIVEKEVVVEEATYWSEAETELRKTFDFEIFIPLILETALYAFLEYCAYHSLALLIGSLATIVQHTKITANIALYNSAKDNRVQNIEEPSDDNHQVSDLIKKENSVPKVKKCTYCGKISPVSLERCECGCLGFIDITHKWRCAECGTMISDDPCPNCGNKVNNE